MLYFRLFCVLVSREYCLDWITERAKEGFFVCRCLFLITKEAISPLQFSEKAVKQEVAFKKPC